MRDVLPTSASQANAHPWSGLERALLVRGASSIVFSERGDVVSVRFAIDDKLVQLEIPRHGDGAGVDWPVVERVLVSKLDAVRSGRSTFAAEFPPAGSRRLELRAGAATAAVLVVALALPLFAFGALPVPATAVRLIKAPFAPLRPHAGDREQRPDRLIVRPRTNATAPVSGHTKHGPRPRATRPEPRSAPGERVAPVSSSIPSTGTLAGGEAAAEKRHVPPGQPRTPPGQAKDGPGPAAPEQANGKAKGHDKDARGNSKPDPGPAKEHGGGSTGRSDSDGGKGSSDPDEKGQGQESGDSGPGGTTGNGGGDPGPGTPPDDHGNGDSGPSGQGGSGGGQGGDTGGGESGPPADTGGSGSGGKDGRIAEALDQ